MERMKQSLVGLFVEIFKHKIDSQRGVITYGEVMGAFNTANKQKINKLLEILFEDR